MSYHTNMKEKKLYRSRKDHMIAGICGGLGQYFGIDSTIVRILFVIISLLPGPSVIFYLIAWIVIPLEPQTNTRKKS